QMFILLDREGFESTLPYVPAPAVQAVIAADVGGQEPPHPATEGAVRVGAEQQVEGGWAEAVGEQPHRGALAGLPQQFGEGGVVAVAVEDAGAAVPAVEDVVDDVSE